MTNSQIYEINAEFHGFLNVDRVALIHFFLMVLCMLHSRVLCEFNASFSCINMNRFEACILLYQHITAIQILEQ